MNRDAQIVTGPDGIVLAVSGDLPAGGIDMPLADWIAAHDTCNIRVRAAHDPSRSQLTIEVDDDGRGIPADTVARLFKRDGLEVRGAGLSLLVMADICAAHAGSIEVNSRIDENHGTRIRLTLTV